MVQFCQSKIIGWFHKQSSQAQSYMNQAFQRYKKNVDECNITFVDDLDIPFIVAPVEFYVDEKGKYNRAKKRQEDRKLIDEYYEEKER